MIYSIQNLRSLVEEYNQNASKWETIPLANDPNFLIEYKDTIGSDGYDEAIVKYITEAWSNTHREYLPKDPESFSKFQEKFNSLHMETYNDIKTSVTYDPELQDHIVRDFTFNNKDKWEKIYNAHKDEIGTSFLDFISDLYDVIYDEYTTYVDFILEEPTTLNNIQVPVFIALANSEHFNIEATNDGADIYYHNLEEFQEGVEPDLYTGTGKDLPPTITFLKKLGYSYRDLLDIEKANDMNLDMVRHQLSLSQTNATLGFIVNIPASKLVNQDLNMMTLTLHKGLELGYHVFICGSGSVCINPIELNRNITYSPDEFTIIPEGTYGYSVASVWDGNAFYRLDNDDCYSFD